MRGKILLALVFLSTTTLSNADNTPVWHAFNFTTMTPDSVILLFGPPATIKTEDLYSDWLIQKARGRGQLDIYAMCYTIATGNLKILNGPLGKASEAEVVIDNGKVCEVVWIYDNNQREPAFQQWISHKELTILATGVIMIGKWKPKKGTILFTTCYTGGDGAICRGPISVHYSKDIE